MLCYEVVAAWLNPFLQRLTHIMIRWLIATNYPNKNNYAARLLFKTWARKEIAKSYRTDVCVGLLSFPSFSSPHLAAFLISFHLSGSSVIGTLTTCSGPAGFLSCKRALHCAKAKAAHICQAISLSLPSARSFSSHACSFLQSPHLCALGVFNQPSPRCRRFICIFRGSGLSINQVYLSKGAIIVKYNNISVSVCHFHFCFSAQADWRLLRHC